MGSVSGSTLLDSRSDEDILAELQTFTPPWCQRNIISWVRRHGKSWTVRVLDMVDGSPTHYVNYIPDTSEFFPEAFLKRRMAGTHAAPHAADLVRLPLLYLHGGIWVDVGFMLFRSLDDLFWEKLEDPANPFELAGFRMTINDEIDRTQGMYAHELLHHLPRYEVPSSTGRAPAFQYGHYVDYLIQMFCLERIRHLEDPTIAWDGPAWFSRKVLLFECVSEVYWV
ncbi:hypothetical protein RJZ90_000395 [Blastomyces dermatitidis]